MGLKDKNVTVITDQKIPMQNIFGDKIGSVLANLSKKNGVNIITNAKVNGIEGEGKVTGVQLEE
jgi:NADPH-dependent 2,4-dienoyl-CoA reductase/sulfur reductase-like enzyme